MITTNPQQERFISEEPSNPTADSNEDLYNPERSSGYIITLTLIVGALQLAWSTEFSEATPFLLSLGISKHYLALIWLAGPLSGTIGQPIVGLLSDRCNSSWGRRRPFITLGAAATLLSLLCLSHSQTIISWFFSANINHHAIPFACIGVYVLDFSIQLIQASARALIVDVVPTSQQQIANAWAARMIGIFNMVGFCLGSINLVKLFPLGDTQFKVLSWLVTFIMGALTVYSCLKIEERDPKTDIAIRMQRQKQALQIREAGFDSENTSISSQLEIFVTQIVHSFKRLPPQVKIVCYTEFFAWVGYFPMLFYTSTYVGELYLYEMGYSSPDSLPPDIRQQIIDESTRRGTLALLANSIVTLAIDCFVPILVEKAAYAQRYHNIFNLKTIWIASHAVFIAATMATFLVGSSTAAIILFSFLGFPWGCAVWIPFAMISEEISRIKDIRAIQLFNQQSKDSETVPGRKDSETELITESEPQMPGPYIDIPEEDTVSSVPVLTSKNKFYVTPELVDFYDRLDYDSGILLAIHNVFVSAPQMLSSLMSSVLFKLFKSTSRYNTSLAWVFRFGGLAAVGALVLSTKVKTETQLYEEDRQRAKEP